MNNFNAQIDHQAAQRRANALRRAAIQRAVDAAVVGTSYAVHNIASGLTAFFGNSRSKAPHA